MASLILKSVVGAVVVLVIAVLAKSKSFYIAGLVPLFPTFSLIAHVAVGMERSGNDLRATAVFGLWSLAPYAIYLIVVYFLSTRLGLAATLGLATVAWALAAAALLAVWPR